MTASGQSRHIDRLPAAVALELMLASQIAAAQSVSTALPMIELAAKAVAVTLRAGKTVIYAAAGSSGLMALADAAELPGTFGISPDQIRIAMAGGIPVDARMPGDTEDETGSAEAVADRINAGDALIVLSASGTTPYALSLAQAAKRRGATVIAIANTPGSSLLGLSDIAVCLPTGPEAIAGSTRLGAGTAQKIALNMISTLTGVLLGHVHDGMMVNLNADNIKLRKRAATIVRTIADVSEKQAESALHHAGHATKDAVLIALGASAAEARALLAANDQHLAPCLDVMASRAQS